MTRPDPRAYPHATGPLFRAAVRTDRVAGDEKSLLDAMPRAEPAVIRERFLARRDDPAFDLGTFLDAQFDRSSPDPADVTPAETVERHVDSLWATLEADLSSPAAGETAIHLPEPHVTPGGVFREAYYWDSHFTAEGLAATGHDDRVAATVANLASLIDRFGFVPNGTRVYYTTRSQPPVFALAVDLLRALRGPDAVASYRDALAREWAFWAGDPDANPRVVRTPEGHRLARYWDAAARPRPESYRRDRRLADRLPVADRPQLFRDVRAACESGWDFSSRWRRDPGDPTSIRTTELAPVDCNAFLYALARTVAREAARAGDGDRADRFDRYADRRRAAVEHHCWQDALGVYTDYETRTDAPTDRVTAATVVPLFVGLADPARAARVADSVADRLLAAGGVVTTRTRSGEQWDAPNGWAPIQWMAAVGLRRYGHDDLAAEIERRWLETVRTVFDRDGRLVEKYDVTDPGAPPVDGEYPTQNGFGWTNGVTAAFAAADYPDSVLGRDSPWAG